MGWIGRQATHHQRKKPHITAARVTAIAMLDIGLHGHDGLDPVASLASITAYVTPRLLHGLEAAVLPPKDLAKIDMFYKKLLRQIQGLPQNVATEAIYLLLNTVPIEAVLHKRVLTLLGCIARLGPENSLYKLALRQLATKQLKSNSWFSQAARIANQYNINAHDAVLSPLPKLSWKRYVKKMVEEHWLERLYRGACSKVTLRYLITTRGRPHQVWTTCRGAQSQVTSATVRAKMLVGRFYLQVDAHKFSQKKKGPIIPPTCQLCNQENEDLAHLLTRCPRLDSTRADLVRILLSLYQEEDLPPPTGGEELTSAILNGGYYEISMGSQHSPGACSACLCNHMSSSMLVSGTAAQLGQYSRVMLDSQLKCTSIDLASNVGQCKTCHILCKCNSTHSQKDSYVIQLSRNTYRANRLCNSLVYRLHRHRDNVLTSIEGSPHPIGGI